tara:strand:- start:805 stop:1008 length:204 start_codon:yes stop_codon:yes gene_type:complete
MAKQLELNFNEKSETLKKLEKEIPDFKRNGFQTREEYLKAKSWDRAFRHFEQTNQSRIKRGAKKCDT